MIQPSSSEGFSRSTERHGKNVKENNDRGPIHKSQSPIFFLAPSKNREETQNTVGCDTQPTFHDVRLASTPTNLGSAISTAGHSEFSSTSTAARSSEVPTVTARGQNFGSTARSTFSWDSPDDTKESTVETEVFTKVDAMDSSSSHTSSVAIQQQHILNITNPANDESNGLPKPIAAQTAQQQQLAHQFALQFLQNQINMQMMQQQQMVLMQQYAMQFGNIPLALDNQSFMPHIQPVVSPPPITFPLQQQLVQQQQHPVLPSLSPQPPAHFYPQPQPLPVPSQTSQALPVPSQIPQPIPRLIVPTPVLPSSEPVSPAFPVYNGVNPAYPGIQVLHAPTQAAMGPVYAVHNFLSHEECDALIHAASDTFVSAPVVGKEPSGTISPSRTSSTSFLAREDLPGYMRKICALTGKVASHCELPQVGRYLPTQQYVQHYDAFDLTNEDGRRFASNGGQRVVTVLTYLNDVARGGHTTFPMLGFSVHPRKGMAVVFFPATVAGQLDPMALHSAEPAVDTKYVSQVWIRQGEYEGIASKRLSVPI